MRETFHGSPKEAEKRRTEMLSDADYGEVVRWLSKLRDVPRTGARALSFRRPLQSHAPHRAQLRGQVAAYLEESDGKSGPSKRAPTRDEELRRPAGAGVPRRVGSRGSEVASVLHALAERRQSARRAQGAPLDRRQRRGPELSSMPNGSGASDWSSVSRRRPGAGSRSPSAPTS